MPSKTSCHLSSLGQDVTGEEAVSASQVQPNFFSVTLTPGPELARDTL